MGSAQCKDLGLPANKYDAVICVGVFTTGHVKGNGLDDIVHVVKPGGLTSFGVNGYVADDPQYEFHEKMNELCAEGKWELVSKYYEPRYLNEIWAWFYVYQIL